MRSIVRCLCIILLNIAVQNAEAKNIKVALGMGRPPYIYSEQGQLKGIEVEVIGEVFRRLGYKATFDTLSPLRLEAEARHGNSYDAVVGVARGNERFIFYSEPYLHFENYVVALKKKNYKIKSVRELAPLKVGTWVNAWNGLGKSFKVQFGPQLNGGYSPNYFEFLNQEDQCLALFKEKVDAIVIDKYVFAWLRMTLAEKEDTEQEVDVFRLFNGESPSYVAFRDKSLHHRFNEELAKFRQSGEYDRVLRNYVGGNLASYFKPKVNRYR